MHRSKARRKKRPAVAQLALPMAIATAVIVIPQLSLKLWSNEPRVTDIPTAINDRFDPTPEQVQARLESSLRNQAHQKHVAYRGDDAR